MLPSAPPPNMYTLELWKMSSSFKFMVMYVWKNKKLRAYLGHVCALHLSWRERVQITRALIAYLCKRTLGVYMKVYVCVREMACSWKWAIDSEMSLLAVFPFGVMMRKFTAPPFEQLRMTYKETLAEDADLHHKLLDCNLGGIQD